MRALKSIGAVAVFLCVLLMLQTASFADSVNIVQRDSYIKDDKGNLRFITAVNLDEGKEATKIGTWVVPKTIFSGWDNDNVVEIEKDISTVENIQDKRQFNFTADILNIPATLSELEFYAKSYIVYKENDKDKYVQAPLASENVDNSEKTKKYTNPGVEDNKPKYYDNLNTSTDIEDTDKTNANVDKSFVTFEKVFKNTDKYLYRVGNANAVALSSLFTANGTPVGVDVKITNKAGNAGVDNIVNNITKETTLPPKTLTDKIQFTGTGVVEVAIKDSAATQYKCTLLLEVVDAINATSAMSATSNNVVLLKNVGFSSRVTVSNGYAIYGNGFKMTCSQDISVKYMSYGFVTLEDGILDNVQIICPNFSAQLLYTTDSAYSANKQSDGSYTNIMNAVTMDGSSKILNSYVSGGRSAVYVTGNNHQIVNSTINGGAVANIHIAVASSLLLKDLTTIQVPTKANVNTTSKTLMGLGVMTICDNDGSATPIILEGELKQYNWANNDYKSYVPSSGSFILTSALSQKNFVHEFNGSKWVNLGFAYLPSEYGNPTSTNITDNRVNKDTIPYGTVSISGGQVYSYTNSKGTDEGLITASEYLPNKYDYVSPKIEFNGSSSLCKYTPLTKTLAVKLDDNNPTYTLNFDDIVVSKCGTVLNYELYEGNTKVTDKSVVLNSSITKNYTLKFTDNIFYDKYGNDENKSEECEYPFTVAVTLTSLPAPVSLAPSTHDALVVASSHNGTWHIATPALNGIKVKSWNSELDDWEEIDLSVFCPSKSGQQSTDKTITLTSSKGTLTVTAPNPFQSSKSIYGKPVVVDGELYFVPTSTTGMVNYGNTARSVVLNYTFKDTNNKSCPFSITFSGGNKTHDGYKQYNYSDFVSGKKTELTASSGGGGGSCLAEGTLITLADGSQKAIEDLTFDDELLVWDFFKGEYTVSQPSLLMDDGFTGLDTIKLKFSDNSDLTIVYEHGLYDVNEKNYIYINKDNVDSYIGHTFIKTDGIENKTVELVDYDIIEEGVHSYTVLTAFHNNCIANGILTVTPPPVPGWYDYFAIGDDMKYDAQSMMLDIAKYGLYEYEDLSDYVSHEEFCAFNGPYLKVLVGKGLITYDDIIEQIGVFMDTNSRRTLD